MQFIGCTVIVVYMTRSSCKKISLFLFIGVLIGIGFYVYKLYITKERIGRDLSTDSLSSHVISNEQLPLSVHIISPQGVNISARVADTDNTRKLGLSYFNSLPDGQGMLFVFPQVGTYSFWMKDMNFALDIIWVDENFEIIDRILNALPSSYPKTFTPSGPARYVIELPANTLDRDGFLIGKKIIIRNDK